MTYGHMSALYLSNQKDYIPTIFTVMAAPLSPLACPNLSTPP